MQTVAICSDANGNIDFAKLWNSRTATARVVTPWGEANVKGYAGRELTCLTDQGTPVYYSPNRGWMQETEYGIYLIETKRELWKKLWEGLQSFQQELIKLFPSEFNAPLESRKSPLDLWVATLNKLLQMGFSRTCPRCHGTGHYSFNLVDGTICYGCSGKKITLPATGTLKTKTFYNKVKAAIESAGATRHEEKTNG